MSKVDALITVTKRGRRWFVIITKADSGAKVAEKSYPSEAKARAGAEAVKKNLRRRGGVGRIQ